MKTFTNKMDKTKKKKKNQNHPDWGIPDPESQKDKCDMYNK